MIGFPPGGELQAADLRQAVPIERRIFKKTSAAVLLALRIPTAAVDQT